MNNMPAFPAPAGVSHITTHGMTLRDYFAAKAMQAMVSVPDVDMRPESSADRAYRQADAMMKAREAS